MEQLKALWSDLQPFTAAFWLLALAAQMSGLIRGVMAFVFASVGTVLLAIALWPYSPALSIAVTSGTLIYMAVVSEHPMVARVGYWLGRRIGYVDGAWTWRLRRPWVSKNAIPATGDTLVATAIIRDPPAAAEPAVPEANQKLRRYSKLRGWIAKTRKAQSNAQRYGPLIVWGRRHPREMNLPAIAAWSESLADLRLINQSFRGDAELSRSSFAATLDEDIIGADAFVANMERVRQGAEAILAEMEQELSALDAELDQEATQ